VKDVDSETACSSPDGKKVQSALLSGVRPENEWRIVQREELRIIDQELWQRVSDRLSCLKDFYVGRRKPGLLQRSATSGYLFSGLLKCGKCGGHLVIITGNKGPGQYRKYGCSQHFYRGACSNNLLERQD